MLAIVMGGCGEAQSTGNTVSSSATAGRFSVLEFGASGSQSAVRRVVPPEAVDQFGLELKDVRIARHLGQAAVLVVPGTRGVCLLVVYPSAPKHSIGNCQQTARARAGHEFVIDGEARAIVGLVPDEVRRVTVRDDDERRRTAVVANNVYVLKVRPVPPVELILDALETKLEPVPLRPALNAPDD